MASDCRSLVIALCLVPPKATPSVQFEAASEIELGGERDIAIVRFGEFPIHFEVPQVLPSITRTDVADGATRKVRRAADREIHFLAPGVHQRASIAVAERRRIMPAAALEMRREQKENAQLLPERFVARFRSASA